jgi:hypothetical protein
MPIIDFKEIPLSSSAGSARDQFELFAREFLQVQGFRIVEAPDRGPDQGRDLIVEELRTGVAGETRIRWLVSCKHKAHSGRSVSPEDEPDIHDRVRTHSCSGFSGFYSTIQSSGLSAKLNASGLPFEVMVYDPELIERQLLQSKEGISLIERFFPDSWKRWRGENPGVAEIFETLPELRCSHCDTNLLTDTSRGTVVLWKKYPREGAGDTVQHVYCCCKGDCDRILKQQFGQKGLIDGWKGLSDLTIPTDYLRWQMSIVNGLRRGDSYSDDAFENLKEILVNIYPLVARNLTEPEKERIRSLGVLPWGLGGYG